MLHLLLATRNRHKRHEFAQMLGDEFALDDLSDHPEIGEVTEDGATFMENAGLKAVAISRQVKGLILADDSGLEVDCLGGAPGIYSARYAGQKASDEQNRQKLVTSLLESAAKLPWKARFRCALAIARAGRILRTSEGSIEGEMIARERGAGGFGYDPIFCPSGSNRTFAELSSGEKNAISHRAMALRQIRAYLVEAAFRD